MDPHLVLTSLHTLAALAALLSGLVVVQTGRGTLAHLATTAAMAGLLLPSLAVSWEDLAPATRAVFSGLVVLAAVMVVQAGRGARRARRVPAGTGPHPDVVAPVGFDVVALLVAGTVVPALRLPSAALTVVVVAVALVAGHVFVAGRVARARRVVGAPADLGQRISA